MFDGFERHGYTIQGRELNVLIGGDGPPVLLLHGYPQSHVMWHAVAPLLRRKFRVVLPDLPGYGESEGPPPDPKHVNYSKRQTGRTMVELMATLGHERFMLAGHDRGGRVGYRLTLDHPQRVSRFAALDIVPTLTFWEDIGQSSALATYHWIFLAQPAPLPETLIGADPDYYIHHLLDRWAGRRDRLDAAAVAEYVRHFRKTSVIAATCEDYRAGASVDVEHDRADRDAGRKIRCPTLLLWARGYLKSKSQAPLQVWRDWAHTVEEVALDCGHFLAEEDPAGCAAALERFFAAS